MTETIALVVSQALAFLLFFWVLKVFAWGPILGLIDERNQKIEDGFRRAEEAEKHSLQLKQEYEERMRAIEAQAREAIQQAVAEGRKTADEIHEQARADAQTLVEKAKQMAQTEMAKARIELRDEIVRYTLAAAEKLINEKMDEPRQRRLVEEFVAELSQRQ